jgi:hypothetical protein
LANYTLELRTLDIYLFWLDSQLLAIDYQFQRNKYVFVNAMDIPLGMGTPKFINQPTTSPIKTQIGKEEILQVEDDFTKEKIRKNKRQVILDTYVEGCENTITTSKSKITLIYEIAKEVQPCEVFS